MSIFDNDLKRLNFEDFIWIIFIILSILNIVGDNYQKEFLKANNKSNEDNANKIFLFVLFISFVIYVYFSIRNINAFNKASGIDKELLSIKVFGSILFVVGIVCLIYFQSKQTNFIGTPI